jgi:hypothetical protein
MGLEPVGQAHLILSFRMGRRAGEPIDEARGALARGQADNEVDEEHD